MTVEIGGPISSDAGRVLKGGDFPVGTEFVGVGSPKITATGADNYAVHLTRAGQTLRNFRVESSPSGGFGFGVRAAAADHVIEDTIVEGAANEAFQLNAGGSVIRGGVVVSGNVGGEDCVVNGENCRVVASDMTITDNSTGGVATAANTDSA